MKRLRIILAALLLQQVCSTATAEDRSWAFVTAVGGLQVGAPFQSDGKWLLPVRADVSGLQAITNKPTTLNSALACEVIRASVRGQDIYLMLETALARGENTSACPAAKLGNLAAGTYSVWYGTSQADRVSLGAVRVAL